MKKIILFICTICLFACSSPEKPNKNIILKYRNETNEVVSVEMFSQNSLKYTEDVNALQDGQSYSFQSPNNFDNFNFICDSIIIKFPNGKGYSCGNSSTLCFPAKPTPFSATEEDFIIDGGIYYYIITEDDYLNAFDL